MVHLKETITSVCSVFLLFMIICSFFACSSCDGGEKDYAFQADIAPLMDIIIKSLYKTKEVFLRELVSNASDALDKLLCLAFNDKDIIPSDWQYNISIRAFPETRQVVIKDTGIGMTKSDLVTNLGTIAKSGTKQFVEKLKENKNATLTDEFIGQFGVGFYSLFLVADKVTVISKCFNDTKHVWTCDINAKRFTVHPATEEEDVIEPVDHCGTKIVLHLKEDTHGEDYMSDTVLKGIIRRHSGYIKYPIYLYTTTTTSVEESLEELLEKQDSDKPLEETVSSEAGEGEGEIKVEDAATKSEPEKKKTKTVTKTESKYEWINNEEPIWRRDPSVVTEEQYNEYYKTISKDNSDPLGHIYFSGESASTSFRGLIYIPKNSFEAFSNTEPSSFLSFYVKRVFVTDNFYDLIPRESSERFPRYLSFIRAVVDAESIPLNVSRETLQKTDDIVAIRNMVVSKTLSLIGNLAKNETAYNEFYKKYSSHLKLGIIEGSTDKKDKLASLLRFHTSESGKNMTSLDDYVSRMKPKQEEIYFVTGTRIRDMKKLPYIEKALKTNLEVVYMNEPFDEHFSQSLGTFKGKTLRNLAKAGVNFSESDEEKKTLEEQTKQFELLVTLLKKKFAATVDSVVVSSNLNESPMAVVSNMYGLTPAMEKLMAGGGKDPMMAFAARQKKIIEINPNHSLMLNWLEKVQGLDKFPEDMEKDVALLYDVSLYHSGFELKDPASFSRRIQNIIRDKYGMELLPKEQTESFPGDKEDSYSNILEQLNKKGGQFDFDDLQDAPMFNFDGMGGDLMKEHDQTILEYDNTNPNDIPSYEKEEIDLGTTQGSVGKDEL